MAIKESIEERKERFKAMSSAERKALIRAKMKVEGLQEGSGVLGKDLSSYDHQEIKGLIEVVSRFPEMQVKSRSIKEKIPDKNKALIAWLLIAIALFAGMVLYYRQYPTPEIRREISTDGMFAD